MKLTAQSLADFIRLLNLKSLCGRAMESCLAWVTHIAKHHGVA